MGNAGIANLRHSKANVIGCGISAVDWDQALATIFHWAARHESRYVCHCNVHSVVTAKGDEKFHCIVNDADLATPDGMPIAWVLRASGFPRQPRISGPDLMWKYCAMAAKAGHKIYLYGGSPETLERLMEKLPVIFPGLRIVGAEAPVLGDHISSEMKVVKRINSSGANVVFVGLGCPKQEYWMAAYRGKISAVMLGVGAAFDFHAGTVKRAPSWMQNRGLEWLYRLFSEPRRLLRRYVVTNVLFIIYIMSYFLRTSIHRGI